jgi:protease I
MLDLFAGHSQQADNHADGHTSDAPRNEPPSLAVAALQWTPKPSIVVAAAAALTAAVAAKVMWPRPTA